MKPIEIKADRVVYEVSRDDLEELMGIFKIANEKEVFPIGNILTERTGFGNKESYSFSNYEHAKPVFLGKAVLKEGTDQFTISSRDSMLTDYLNRLNLGA